MWCAIFFLFISWWKSHIIHDTSPQSKHCLSFWCDIRIIWNGDTECDVIKLALWYLICDQWLVEYLICDICDWLILMYVKSDVIGCWFFWSVIGWFKGCDVNLCPVIGWFQNVTWNLQYDWLLTPCDWVDKCWVGGSRLWTLLFRFGDFCIAFCKLQP